MICIEGYPQRTIEASQRKPKTWAKQQLHPKREGSVPPLISIVDDDESVRESLPELVRELGFAALAFSSAEKFLASSCASETECLILDISMPGMSGPELQEELKRRRREIPIVFITAQTSKDLRAHLLAQGAIECLTKPFSDAALLDALNLSCRSN